MTILGPLYVCFQHCEAFKYLANHCSELLAGYWNRAELLPSVEAALHVQTTECMSVFNSSNLRGRGHSPEIPRYIAVLKLPGGSHQKRTEV